jgi:hypothetical protein
MWSSTPNAFAPIGVAAWPALADYDMDRTAQRNVRSAPVNSCAG